MGKKKLDSDGDRMTTLKVRGDLLKMMRMIATFRDLEMSQYTESLLRPQVLKDYAKMVSELNAEQG
jgi:hypothetical protein